MSKCFEITNEQEKQINEWIDEQDQTRIAEMLASNDEFLIELAKDGIPHYGAIGGSVTYSFTPTSLGVVLKVKHGFSKSEIDVTEYEDW